MSDAALADLMEVIGEMRSDLKTLVSRGVDQETRIRSLETWRNWCAGVAAAVAGSYGALQMFGPSIAKAFGGG